MKYRCAECDTWLDLDDFFLYKNKLPMKTCKRCTCQGVNPSDESSFLWILEELDIPYIKKEWNNIQAKMFAEDCKKPKIVILKKYIAKMKLPSYKNYKWEDSEILNKM